MLRCAFTYLLVLFSFLCRGQEVKDSSTSAPRIPTVVRYITEADYAARRPVYLAPDTAIDRLHQVFTTDSGTQFHLGNSGSALTPIWFNPTRDITTTLGINVYDGYSAGPAEQAYFRTNKRYSRIDFWQGAFRESGIRFLHSQNITRKFNLGVSIDRFTVKEFLPEGDTYFNRIALFGNYESTNRRYRLFVHASWMRIRNQVNGGLSSDSAFLAGGVDNLGLKGAAVRLSDAAQRIRRRELYLSQYYHLGQGSPSDSLSFPWRIGWSTRYRRDTYTYLDNTTDSSYFRDFFLNTSQSYDSTLTDQLSNRVLLERSWSRRAAPLLMQLFAEDQRVQAYQLATSQWDNQLVGFAFSWGADTGLVNLKVNARQVIRGRDQDNGELTVSLAGVIGHLHRWKIRAGQSQVAVPLVYSSYFGNHDRWENDFRSPLIQQLNAEWSVPDWRLALSAGVLRIDGYVYMGYDMQPEQSRDQLGGLQLELFKEFRIGKWGLDNRIRYQSFNDPDRIRLPDVILQHTLFFEDDLFNKALLLRAGLDAWYCDQWNGAAYAPSTSLFYLQKSTLTGGYLRTDLFLNLKIKTAGLFLRFTNLTDGLTANAYALVPGYPQPGRVFHFGVRWMFFDQ